MADITNKRILLISLRHKPLFDQMFDGLLAKLSSDAQFKHAKTRKSALRFLSNNPPPRAVIVTDEALTKYEECDVRSLLSRYIRQGGTAIFMGHFPAYVEPSELRRVFSYLDLPWEAGSYPRLRYRLTHMLNPLGWHLAPHLDELPAQYSQKALFVKNVRPRDALYQTTADSTAESHDVAPEILHDPNEAAVVVAAVENGTVAYLGDLNGEPETTAVTLALCGL